MMLVEAWADSECSGDSNTVAINRRVDFLKKKLAHQCSGCALGGRWWWRKTMWWGEASAGAVTGSVAKVGLIVVMRGMATLL